ncbi:MAG TPA: aminotransferase class V-fold PLP-dependent enzyme [Mycobacteriales bacterium]|nr:aminotransferase class V-fold PLP-dependent enzyme [Mycobacteriales bacterium]
MTADPPVWPGDHDAVRSLWALDPSVAYVNHGAFGAAPRPVLEEQARLRALLEADPFDFLYRRYESRLREARVAVAALLNADPDGLAFVPNASTGVATVVRALGIGPGDRVVVTDHAYQAVLIALRAVGADVVVVALDLAAPDLAGPVLDAVDERTRLVVVDAIASATAVRMPFEALVAGCRARGVPCVVDAAHAPGHLPVDLRALDPDWWTGNLHKWCCTPRGAAVLWTRAAWRDRTHPLVPSHGYGQGYAREFDWVGTHDPTAWLVAPAAIALLASLGPALPAYCRDLAAWGAALTGLPRPVDPARHERMVLLDAGLASGAEAEALRDALWHDDRVEVGGMVWRGRGWVRVSTAVYNRPQDYERLARSLRAHGRVGAWDE